MSKTGKNWPLITLQMPPALVADLDREADARRMPSRVELIRQACQGVVTGAPITPIDRRDRSGGAVAVSGKTRREVSAC